MDSDVGGSGVYLMRIRESNQVIVLDWIVEVYVARESNATGYYTKVMVRPLIGAPIEVASFWGPGARTWAEKPEPERQRLYAEASDRAAAQAAEIVDLIEARLREVAGPTIEVVS